VDERVLTDEPSVQTLNFTADITLILKNRDALFVGVEVCWTMLLPHKFVLSYNTTRVNVRWFDNPLLLLLYFAT
jgi:hypothetical protein